MTKISLVNRISSGLIAVLMVISLFFLWPMPSFAATAEDHTNHDSRIENEYLVATLTSDGRMALYTTGGNPDTSSDNNERLLYGGLGSGTSKVVLNVDGYTTSVNGNVYATPTDDSLYSKYTYNGVQIETFVSFAYNTYTGRYDTMEYKYVLTNISDVSKEAGVRIFFDTMLGSNDSAPFRIAGTAVTTHTTYTGENIPREWQVFDSLTNPTVVASGTFYQDVNDRPDKVQFLSYGNGYHDGWDCTGSGSIGDSAVNVYYNPKELAPGESRTVKTYYGLSQFVPDPDEPIDPDPNPVYNLGISAMAPQELTTNYDNTEYVGNPFSFSGWIQNTGNMTAENVYAVLNLPDGLTADETTVYLGNIDYNESAAVYWNITAENRESGAYLEYSVTYYADNVDAETVYYSIYVPGLDLRHYHEYTTESYTPPTCENAGYTYYYCECGEYVYTYHAPLGHNYSSEVQCQATCTTPGIINHVCYNCGDSYLTYVYAEHSYEISEFVPADCYVDGHTTYTCVNCSDQYIEYIPASHSYVGEVTKVATQDEEGEITYTCSVCGDWYTEILPMRPSATILLIQDRLPWTENINTAILDRLVDGGYAAGWDMITSNQLGQVDLSLYSVIYIANDQSTSTYNRLAEYNGVLENFASLGGVVVYGACDNGWAGGEISYALPGGVTKDNYYSYRNYIVNYGHNVVTGVLTDGKALTNELLYSTYSSHTYFTNLPDGAVSILEDANGRPTLVEYPIGAGYVIASGLTWEYTYVRNYINGTSFSKSVYDDLLVHALLLGGTPACDHVFDGEVITFEPTCTQDGYYAHHCTECGYYVVYEIIPALGHVYGEWQVIVNPGQYEPGYEVVKCERCDEIIDSREIPPVEGPLVTVDAGVETVIIGQTVTFVVYVSDANMIKSMALTPVFDSSVFELVSAEWLVDATVQYIDPSNNNAASAWSELTDVNGAVFSFTLRANALTDVSEVSCVAMYQEGHDVQNFFVNTDRVAVIQCPHENGYIEILNDEYHARICSLCGYSEIMAHSYDNDCDATCNYCDYVRDVDHYSDLGWICDENGHWQICDRCGEQFGAGEHEYDGYDDCFCNHCGYFRALRGDMNNDGFVTSDDAIYLLLYTYYSEQYPITQSGDMNGDGQETSDDAIHLLLYTYYSEQYPLYYPEGY